MNIVLVEINPEKHSMTMELVPPLGLGYIASSLEAAGHNVRIITGVQYGDSIDKACELISAVSPAIVGITATSQARFRAARLAQLLKKTTGAFIVAGGPHFHATAKEALINIKELDVVVKGEGEITMLELANAYSAGSDLRAVKGIFYRDGQKIVENEDRPVVMDLDSFPQPAYHLFNLSKYNCKLEGTDLPAIGVVSSRGCPNNCIFCANRVLRKTTLRLRDPIKFVAEIETLKKRYGYSAFDIWDDTLTMSRKHIKTICEEILKRKLDIKWFARARVNTVDKDVLSLMKDAGCIHIAYGIESGSEKILKVINKGISLRQAEDAVKASVEVGMIVSNYFIVSLPGETLKDIDDTLQLMRKFENYKNVRNFYCFAMVYPGTDLEKIAIETNRMPKGFSWYSPFFCEKNIIVGNDPVIPCYEQKDLTIDQIKAHILKSASFMYKLKKAIRRIGRIRSFKEAKDMAIFLSKYLFPQEKC